MEETKLKVAEATAEEVLTYEQLEDKVKDLSSHNEKLTNYVNQLYSQNQQLQNALKQINVEEINISRLFKRLEFLFEVLKQPVWFDDEFVKKCSDEIVDILTVKPEDKEEEEDSEEDTKTDE